MHHEAPNNARPSAALYHALLAAYDHFNSTLFSGELPDVIFTVQRQKDLLGYFAAERWTSPTGERCHEIAINPTHMGQSRVIEVLQTLVHEMVHCWQHCYGHAGRRSYHNKEWAYKMMEVGLQPSSTGAPGGDIVGQQMSDYPIENGRFLLACESLVRDKSFTLPWIYRLQARTATSTEGEPILESVPDDKQPGSTLAQRAHDAESIQSAVIEAHSPEAYLYATYNELMPDDTFFTPHAPKTKKKTTYQCPSCLTKVWGRPDLNIACSDCNRQFYPL